MWESLLPLCSWFLSRIQGFMTACYGDIFYISLPSLFFLGTQPICFPGGIYFYYFRKCPSAWIYTFNPSWLSLWFQCSLSLNVMIHFWDFSYGLIALIVWWVVGAVWLVVWVYLKVVWFENGLFSRLGWSFVSKVFSRVVSWYLGTSVTKTPQRGTFFINRNILLRVGSVLFSFGVPLKPYGMRPQSAYYP